MDEILAVEARWFDPIRSGNSVALEHLLSDELLYTHSIATVVTKRGLIRTLKPDVQAIEYSDRKIRVLGTAAGADRGSSNHGCLKRGMYQEPRPPHALSPPPGSRTSLRFRNRIFVNSEAPTGAEYDVSDQNGQSFGRRRLGSADLRSNSLFSSESPNRT